ncbi:MAG: glutathione S-transferase family protein, partial [Betaproteobacteria bacterium]
SWSLRPWFLLKHAGIAFDEVRIPLYQDGHVAKIRGYSAAGKVPILIDGGITVWESLAICEYLAERHADRRLWPDDPGMRAYGRAISTEMHGGFAALRTRMGMNVRRIMAAAITPEVAADIARIEAIWGESLRRYGGPFLLGTFSIADAMFAPVATRFKTYAVALSATSQRYADQLLALPAMKEWYAAAATEPEVLPQFEPQQ